MKKVMISLAVIAFAAPAFAQAGTFAELDADQNGEVSFEELTVAMPDLTVEKFATADTDANGALSEEEYNTYISTM